MCLIANLKIEKKNEYLTRKIVFEADSKIFPPENIYVLVEKMVLGKRLSLKELQKSILESMKM